MPDAREELIEDLKTGLAEVRAEMVAEGLRMTRAPRHAEAPAVIARYLGMSKQHLLDLCWRGCIHFYRTGTKFRSPIWIRLRVLADWILAQESGTT